MIEIKRFVCNMLQENCYVVSDDTSECVIVDCGAFYEAERKAIVEYIRDNNLQPRLLLCTHGHVDHNFGIDTICNSFALTPVCHADDLTFMQTLSQQAVQFIGYELDKQYPEVTQFVADGDELTFGTHTIKVIHTPGHSRGSVCFYISDENILLTGDTLFNRSIGRTDLPGGSMMQIIQSLRLLAQMPDETIILPGHGGHSTMGDELRLNPFLDR